MPENSRRTKNNNLEKHRKKMQGIYTGLIQKAISHIQSLNGEITMSAVSRVSYEIADREAGEKGITLPGISKNPEYRTLIERAKADQRLHFPEERKELRSKYLSEGDIRMMLHALRVENAELKRENKILAQQLKNIPDTVETVAPVEEKVIAAYNTMQNVIRAMTNRLCELELTYIDAANETLNIAHYEDVVVPSEALKLYYEKELDEIRNNT
jgi:regulator of replication initiation timing